MSDAWMLYGAYGYTGRLLAEEAVRRGHRPLLAGRSEDKLAPLAERHGLDWVAVKLDDDRPLREALGRVALVLHAAGPFVHTSPPMVRACLETGTHYLDITGEIPVFQHTFARDQLALTRGIALISGVGFDVVPTDCLADHLAQRVPNAIELELAVAALGQASPGTAKTMLELFPKGVWVRRDGRLVRRRWGRGVRRVRFSDRERTVVPIPWGDLETAFQTTGIPNITTYMALPRATARLLSWLSIPGRWALAFKPLRRLVQGWAAKSMRGPDAETRRTARSYVWARVADAGGREAQAWLEAVEAYRFTALAGVRCVEKVLEMRPKGALTPALAFGADLVLEIEGTRRYDAPLSGQG